ncbi:hypothetical protein B4Q13_23690 [Lacticaseibacillus rhamnosus]
MAATYAGSASEPVVLPSRFPNLLVNGSQGIAVGMATNVPPHNMGEVIDAAIHVLHHPDATPDELMEFVKGPDFPTGGIVVAQFGTRPQFDRAQRRLVYHGPHVVIRVGGIADGDRLNAAS